MLKLLMLWDLQLRSFRENPPLPAFQVFILFRFTVIFVPHCAQRMIREGCCTTDTAQHFSGSGRGLSTPLSQVPSCMSCVSECACVRGCCASIPAWLLRFDPRMLKTRILLHPCLLHPCLPSIEPWWIEAYQVSSRACI